MLSWLFHIIFIILFIIIYLHICVHFRISKENEFIELDDICRKEITNNIYFKQPFYFDGSSIKRNVKLNDDLKTSHKGYDSYTLTYESIPLLEPTVKFFPKSSVYYFRKANKNAEVETNLECRNFYIVHKGKAKITCIHPKYTEHFLQKDKNIDFIKTNDNMIHVELDENKILFVPNYWYIFMESVDKDTLVEKIQYKTILNRVNFIYDNIINDKSKS
jgi:hypothetical protein